MQVLEGGVSRFLKSEEGKCSDISYGTGDEVFIITYFHKLIHRPFDNEHRPSSHKKLSIELMSIICVIQGTSQTGSKITLLSPLTTVHIFSILRSHEVKEGA